MKLLLVDRRRETCETLQVLISKFASDTWELDWISDYEAALIALTENRHALALIARDLGPHTGLDLLRAAHSRACRAPLILLIASPAPHPDPAELEMAAPDFLLREPLEAPAFEWAVRCALRHQKLRQDLSAAQTEVQEGARRYEALQSWQQMREQALAQLIHTEKMAALGRLVGSVAHEINNPLQAIKGCLTLAQEDLQEASVVDPALRENLENYLQITEEESERISVIVRRVRDFYREVRPGLYPTDLHAVLENVLTLSNKQLQENRVTLTYTRDETLQSLPANPDDLKQVFLSLIFNSIDAMPQGGTLGIRTERSQFPDPDGRPPRPAARIEFRDTGTGMSHETLDRLFEPFFTTKKHSSGLGLSISYGIVQAHHGEIYVDSQPGQGSCFTILLPLA